MTALNVLWEWLHLPLYTLWKTGTWREIAFAVLHCTAGDVLIALVSLVLALLVAGRGDWPGTRFAIVAALAIAAGLGYTVFSEWLNVAIRKTWAYSDLMPILRLWGLELGLSPLLQWLVVPLLGCWCIAPRSVR